ncbi:MAG: 1,6-anhydro-N-acetylmuramyl-L-alanine amidase AmpD [Sulfurifustaceae bacterium]
MRVDATSGLVEGARFVPSPNCDARPVGAVPEVLIVHAISLPPGEFGGTAIERLFCNSLDAGEHPYYEQIKELRVSAHLLVRRSGEIVQFVPLHIRAWHAGQSQCEGRTRVNDFSIGVELEGCDDAPFEDTQYGVLADLTKHIMRAYPAITSTRLYGHSDIAPGRKTDPGPFFDWARLRALLGMRLAAHPAHR